MHAEQQRQWIRRRIQETGLQAPKQPLKVEHDRLGELLEEALETGHYSLTALLGYEEPWKTAFLLWTHRQKPYATTGPTSVTVLLRNVSALGVRVNYKAKTKKVFIQAMNALQNHTHTYQKEVGAGGTLELPIPWATNAIWKHGRLGQHDLMAEFEPERVVQGALVEVRGLVVLDGTRYEYELGGPDDEETAAPETAPEPEPAPKGRKRRSAADDAGSVDSEG